MQAYAVHNPDVAYCQSLNFIAGMMLLFMQEEETFWLLATIIDKLLPKNYYTKNMIDTYCDQHVLGHMIKTFLPKVYRYSICWRNK